MLADSKGLKIYRLLPEDVERLLVAEYGDKLVAVNTAKLEKRNQRSINYAAHFRKKENKVVSFL